MKDKKSKSFALRLGADALSIFYLEIVLCLFTIGGRSAGDYLCTALYSLFWGLVTALLSSLFGPRLNRALDGGLSVFFFLLYMGQVVHYRLYYCFFSVYSMVHGGQVFGFMEVILGVLWRDMPCLLLMLAPLALRAVLLWNRLDYSRPRPGRLLAALVAAVLLFFSIPAGFSLWESGPYSYSRLYNSVHAPALTVKSFGLLTEMRLDLERMAPGFEEDADSVERFGQSKPESEPQAALNQLDIDWQSLSSDESDSSLAAMDRYFSSLEPTAKNEMTGLYSGKNLIVIMAESLWPAAIDRELTPTLWKLGQEGYSFGNYYSPIYYVSTSDGEYVSLNSLLPKEGVWSMFGSSGNLLPFAYGNIFGSLGYKTTAYHDGQSTYYSRDMSHPNMGYERFIALGSGLDIDGSLWPASDLDMIEATAGDYLGESHFITYYLTVSGHLNYSLSNNAMAQKHYDEVRELSYSEPVKCYLACQIELDRALERLLELLEEAGHLDDTAIVISGDHYPYGLSQAELEELSGPLDNDKFDTHRGCLVIWDSSAPSKSVGKYCYSADILPTVLNLFGVEFDSRLLMGRDIFSEDEGLVIFNDRSFISDRGRYDSISGSFTSFGPSQPDEEYIESTVGTVYDRFLMSRLILEKDYYRRLFG